jgi:hypothetical protein
MCWNCIGTASEYWRNEEMWLQIGHGATIRRRRKQTVFPTIDDPLMEAYVLAATLFGFVVGLLTGLATAYRITRRQLRQIKAAETPPLRIESAR